MTMASRTAKKPTAANKKPVAAKPAPVAIVTEEGVPVDKPQKNDSLKKKDLIQRVVAVMDGKKKGGVKEVVEATLSVLGEALQNGEALNLPPFGKARVAKSKGEGKTASLTVKLREAGQKKTPRPPKEALADPGEDG